MTKKTFLQEVAERESAKAVEEMLGRLGRKPLPDGAARYERTTIRWRESELETIRRVAPGVSVSDAIRDLTLEAAARREKEQNATIR